MMRLIDAEQKVTVTIYDEEHEEHHDKIMTVEEMLDTYTNEGCPLMYSIPEPKQGKWIKYNPPIPEKDDGVEAWDCSVCSAMVSYPTNYCPNCGARMEREHEVD